MRDIINLNKDDYKQSIKTLHKINGFHKKTLDLEVKELKRM